MAANRKVTADICVVLLLALVVFLIASLATYDVADNMAAFPTWLTAVYHPDQLVYPGNREIQNACGSLGAWTADLLVHALGFGAYYLIVGLIALQISLFRQQSLNHPWIRGIGWGLSLLGLTALFSFLVPQTLTAIPIGAGGLLGSMTQRLLAGHVATLGGVLIAAVVTVTGLMMWTDYLIFRAGKAVIAPALVAGSRLLPFGMLHRFFVWINRRAVGNADLTEPGAVDFTAGSDLPRAIRVKGSDGESAEVTYGLRGSDVGTGSTLSKPTVTKRSVDPVVETPTAVEIDDEETAQPEIVETLASVEPEPTSIPIKPHFPVTKPAASKPAKPPSERDEVILQLNAAADTDSGTDYALPSIELLRTGTAVSFDDQKREALEKAEMLEKTCKEFGYNVRVVEIETGPVISQYEIQLEAGLRLQKITALADDLAIALRVPSVRIVAPIPGKNTVGVEVPNETRELVRLREVIEQSGEKTKKMKIPLFLGKDAVGAPMVVDLASLPHLLIAGRTGTGKSVCLNAIITSILMTRRPDEVRMLMIDPKMVELSGYGRLPHLMHPVVTDMRKAEAILAWAVDKMEERYKLLAQAGVRHITTFNQLGEDEIMNRLKPEDQEARDRIPTHLPFIVIVADEMADLMMTAGKEVEQHIIRLAQKSRAVGIHLILATQKPTVDVITGLIKSNLPARIAFQVASKVDSRVVLDAMGADKLLGNGDMLFLWPGTSNLLRGQGTYLSDEEIEGVTASVSTGEQHFVQELIHIKVKKEGEDEPSGETRSLPARDDLYDEAIEIVIREGRGSVSLLQRALRIGYGRAARLIDFMEEDGIVGAYNGSNARDVVMTMSQWQAIKSGGDDEDGAVAEAAPTPIRPLETTSARRNTKLAASQSAAPPAKKSRPPAPPSRYDEDDDDEDDDDEEDDDTHDHQRGTHDLEFSAEADDEPPFDLAPDDDFEYEDYDEDDFDDDR
jgi:DNA segregation ATPase FtsK/SpoIIIE, S-DNA-T family